MMRSVPGPRAGGCCSPSAHAGPGALQSPCKLEHRHGMLFPIFTAHSSRYSLLTLTWLGRCEVSVSRTSLLGERTAIRAKGSWMPSPPRSAQRSSIPLPNFSWALQHVAAHDTHAEGRGEEEHTVCVPGPGSDTAVRGCRELPGAGCSPPRTPVKHREKRCSAVTRL